MYSCQFCEKQFAKKCNKERHERLHCQAVKNNRYVPPSHRFSDSFDISNGTQDILDITKAINKRWTFYDVVRHVSRKLFQDSKNHRIIITNLRSKTCMIVNEDLQWQEVDARAWLMKLCQKIMAQIIPVVHEYYVQHMINLSRPENRILTTWLEYLNKNAYEYGIRLSPSMKHVMNEVRYEIQSYTQKSYGKKMGGLSIPRDKMIRISPQATTPEGNRTGQQM